MNKTDDVVFLNFWPLSLALSLALFKVVNHLEWPFYALRYGQ